MSDKKSKKAKHISAQNRVRQFPAGTLHAHSGFLFCQGRGKKQATAALVLRRGAEWREAALAFVEAFTAANIPLEKLDHPRLRDYLPGTGGLPCAARLRQDYLPGMLASRAPSPWALPPGEAVAVVVAEATDAHGHCVLRLLFVPSGWAPHGPSVFEAEPVPLASLSSTVVAQAVVKAVITHGVDFNRVSAFLSGHAVYMCRAFSDVLQGMMPGAVHVTCNAHILSLVSDIWRMHFPDVDTLVSSLKKAFEHCPGRKLRYGEFVANQSGELQAAVPLTVEPAPVKCNSWFDAVCYHAKNIQHYQQFVRQELEITPGTQYMLKLHELLKQGDIGDKVEFVAENVTPFRELLTWFEGRQVLNHNMHNKLMDLISWVEDMASQQLSDCPTENQRRQDVFQAIAAKLKQFYKYDPSLPPRFKQPAAAFFSAVRIFDPNQINCFYSGLRESELHEGGGCESLPMWQILRTAEEQGKLEGSMSLSQRWMSTGTCHGPSASTPPPRAHRSGCSTTLHGESGQHLLRWHCLQCGWARR
ncbi:hypothetical protein Y1Q_0001836 [Alligator mississippiensis]|uniref:Uncharacterized protein n=1 Tax=Alligator mississippiensis TaxID=8496 RepID=A0A151MMQ5_ALLMI|nr:hypothetical protein Y1Q_0001836 [Alligator mississippiensis]